MAFASNDNQQLTLTDSTLNLTQREKRFLEKSWAKTFMSMYHRLCVLASSSLIIDKFICFTLIKTSSLHLGQYRGKFLSSVSPRILIRVL